MALSDILRAGALGFQLFNQAQGVLGGEPSIRGLTFPTFGAPSARVGPGGFTPNIPAGFPDPLTGLRPGEQQIQTGLETNLSRIGPSFGALTEDVGRVFGTRERAAESNLRAQLARRNVLGASFANDQISQLRSDFAQQESFARSTVIAQGLQLELQNLSQQAQVQTQRLQREFLELGIPAQLQNSILQLEAARLIAEAELRLEAGRLQGLALDEFPDILDDFLGSVGGIFDSLGIDVGDIFGGVGNLFGFGADSFSFGGGDGGLLGGAFADIFGSSSGGVTGFGTAGAVDTGSAFGSGGLFGSGTSFLDALGGGFTGFGVGSFFGDTLGIGDTTGSQIGGTVGGIGGSFLPIPGGTFIGSAIGSLIGGLFGGSPSVGPNASATMQITTDGTFKLNRSGADNGGDLSSVETAVKNITTTVNNFVQLMGGTLENITSPGGSLIGVTNFPGEGGISITTNAKNRETFGDDIQAAMSRGVIRVLADLAARGFISADQAILDAIIANRKMKDFEQFAAVVLQATQGTP